MSTPRPRAGYLRGGLVGVCSALMSVVAHTAAGGEVPAGAALTMLTIVCATLGGVVGSVLPDARGACTGLVISALCAGQALGHLTLTVASSHHGHSGWMLTVPMLVVHAAAAVGLGVMISLAEYLYAACASVLSWLRLFAAGNVRPEVRTARLSSNVIVVQAVLLRAGLGVRAPPPMVFCGRV